MNTNNHPGIIRLQAAVAAAELGLLRSIAFDRVIAVGPREHTRIEADVSDALSVIRGLTGPAEVRLQANITPTGTGHAQFWSLLGQTDRDVIVSLHVSHIDGGEDDSVPLVDRIRVAGTHGWVMDDLLHPALDVTSTKGSVRVRYGIPPSRNREPDEANSPDPLIQAITRSADEQREASISW